jgi:hypothetical protein
MKCSSCRDIHPPTQTLFIPAAAAADMVSRSVFGLLSHAGTCIARDWVIAMTFATIREASVHPFVCSSVRNFARFCVSQQLPADCGRVDAGQTNSVLFHLSVWLSSVIPNQRTADGLTMDRRILFFFTYQSSRRVHAVGTLAATPLSLETPLWKTAR